MKEKDILGLINEHQKIYPGEPFSTSLLALLYTQNGKKYTWNEIYNALDKLKERLLLRANGHKWGSEIPEEVVMSRIEWRLATPEEIVRLRNERKENSKAHR